MSGGTQVVVSLARGIPTFPRARTASPHPSIAVYILQIRNSPQGRSDWTMARTPNTRPETLANVLQTFPQLTTIQCNTAV
jgi:hypothetical protein